MSKLSSALLIAGGLLAWADPASAQQTRWEPEVYAGVVSDYRFRGLSLSGDDPALQAGVSASHATGFYAALDLSGIEEYGIGLDGDGADLEVSLTTGWTGSVGGVDLDVGLSAFVYPDGSDVSYFELPVTISRTIGNATWRGGFAYAPAQNALDDEDNRYLWGDLEYAPPGWAVSLKGGVGYEDGAYAPGGKTDWLAGIEMPVGPLVYGVHYVDSSTSEGSVVFSAFVNF